jgi:perosamine synthetase
MRIPLSQPDIDRSQEEAILRTIRNALRSGRLARGPILRTFERQFSEYLGVKHSLAVSNGTAALHLALLAHGIGPGDVVVTTPFTFIATVNPILYVGATPKFVDIDPVTYNIDAQKLQDTIDSKTKALIVAHVFGLPCDMKTIVKVCEDRGVVLIEDACEALGASYDGRKVGAFGTSCFSFYPNKVVTTAEGGMLCTNDDGLSSRVDSLRNQGRSPNDWLEHTYVGYNYRLSEVQAGIGVPQLRKLDRVNSIREKKAKMYAEMLRQYPQIRIPPNVEGRTWFAYVVELDDRDRIGRELNASGIECKPYFPPVHLQTPYRQIGFMEGDFPISESTSRRVLALPFFTQITSTQIRRVVATLGRLIN